MSLTRLYGLNEARDREITLASAEKQWPDAVVRLDHEVPSQGKVRLFIGGEGDLGQGQYSGHEGQLLASVFGGGWYQWDGEHWKKRDEKPGQARGKKYVQNKRNNGIHVPGGADDNPGEIDFMHSGHRYHIVDNGAYWEMSELLPDGTWDDFTNDDPRWQTPGLVARYNYATENGGFRRNGQHKSHSFGVHGNHDSSVCPDCGYYGSETLPEECPNCNPELDHNADED